MKTLTIVFASILLISCAIGHKGWLNLQDSQIGRKAYILDPTEFEDFGEIIRGDFLIEGYGLTHITYDKNNMIQHWFESEVLPSYSKKEWVGKCKYFLIVNPKNNIVLDWGFEENSNPLSCRVWP